jgi:hypothetical protein
MIWIKAFLRKNADQEPMWQPISTAPYDHELELAVIDESGPHALIFPCCRILCGWIDARTKRRVEIDPTHWRAWNEGRLDH